MERLNENLLKSLISDLQEADRVTKDMLSWTGEVNALSWKFPNHRSDTIEPTKLIEEYSGSSDDKYLFTLEIVIDRLNFFLHVLSRYLESFSRNNEVCSVSPNETIPPFRSLGALINEIWRKAKPMYYLLSESKENGVEDIMIKSHHNHAEKAVGLLDKISQTSLTSLDHCEHCNISMNIIKSMMSNLESLFEKISQSEDSETNHMIHQSEITKFKERMGPEFFNATQWAAITHLAEAITADLLTLQDVVEKCFSDLISQKQANKDQEIKFVKLQKENKKLVKNISNGKMKENKLMSSQSKLENSITKKDEEFESLIKQHKKLDASYEKVKAENNELNRRLLCIQQDLVTVQEELDMKTNEVCIFKQKYKTEIRSRKNAQEEAQAARANVERLEEQLIVVQRNTDVLSEEWDRERIQITTECDDIQRKLAVIKDEKDTLVNIINLINEEISEIENANSSLKLELKEIRQDQLMLVKYPDLNGPVEFELIGKPDVDMQSQINANNVRIKILENENLALERTLEKYKRKTHGTEV